MLAESVTAEQAKAMLSLVDQLAQAELRVTRMRTRTGFGRPAYELMALKQPEVGSELGPGGIPPRAIDPSL